MHIKYKLKVKIYIRMLNDLKCRLSNLDIIAVKTLHNLFSLSIDTLNLCCGHYIIIIIAII